MIFSPFVPIIRNAEEGLIPEPYLVHMITAAAVNKGVVVRRGGEERKQIPVVMEKRIRKILLLAMKEKVEVLVLGAFGCGVFQNNPKDVANMFRRVLSEDTFRYAFKHIVFAVFDRSPKEETYQAFRQILIN